MTQLASVNYSGQDIMGKETPRSDLVSGERLKTCFYLSSSQSQVMDVESAQRLVDLELKINPIKYSYAELLKKFEEVGDDWHERDEHKNGRRSISEKILEGRRTYNWEITSGKTPIGFCCAVKKGFNSDLETMVHNFSEAAQLRPNDGMEIYKVALFRDYTNKKIGRTIFPMIHDRIFRGQAELIDVSGKTIPTLKPSKFIFLSSTIGPKFNANSFEGNLVDSRPHYKRLGYSRVAEHKFTIHAPFSQKELNNNSVPKIA